jgi:hypothetical protein
MPGRQAPLQTGGHPQTRARDPQEVNSDRGPAPRLSSSRTSCQRQGL